MVAQHYEYTENHWIVHFKWVDFYVNYISVELIKMFLKKSNTKVLI